MKGAEETRLIEWLNTLDLEALQMIDPAALPEGFRRSSATE
jgi:hypothetical protein